MKKKQKILVVDDDRVNNRIVSYLCELFNYEVSQAYNGLEALNYCNNQNFDIILMDINMPVMDGLTANNKIKDIYRQKGHVFKAFAITAAFNPNDPLMCNAGFDKVLAKPVNASELKSLLVA